MATQYSGGLQLRERNGLQGGFGATGDHDVCLAEQDLFGGQADRISSRSAGRGHRGGRATDIQHLRKRATQGAESAIGRERRWIARCVNSLERLLDPSRRTTGRTDYHANLRS